MMSLLKRAKCKEVTLRIFSCFFICCYVAPLLVSAQPSQGMPKITPQQAKALKMLNQQEVNSHQVKNLSLQITKLSDSQGQVYIGALVSRAELLPYLSQLKAILADDFERYRTNQAARDHQSFHMTLINPIEYQHVDKQLIEQLLNASTNINFSSHLRVTLLGLGKAEKAEKRSYFVVAQSSDAQLIRQRFLLSDKDLHVTLGFEPSDIYDVKKNSSTLVDLKAKL